MIKCDEAKKNIILPLTFKGAEINNIILKDEFNNKEFSKAINRTILRADLPGAGKTTNLIMYYKSINKKILVVCSTKQVKYIAPPILGRYARFYVLYLLELVEL